MIVNTRKEYPFTIFEHLNEYSLLRYGEGFTIIRSTNNEAESSTQHGVCTSCCSKNSERSSAIQVKNQMQEGN